jgi:catechol 2,3-dioxygenase-like lactoylglutathione lyase family enzyme
MARVKIAGTGVKNHEKFLLFYDNVSQFSFMSGEGRSRGAGKINLSSDNVSDDSIGEPMIARIDHLNVVVTDLERAKEFFFLLGFTEGISSELDAGFMGKLTGIEGARGRFVALHHPTSDLSIELLKFDRDSLPDESIGRADRLGFRHLALAVTDIEAEVQRLRENGVEFISDIQTWERTGKKLVYFHGPEGILLELAQYPA